MEFNDDWELIEQVPSSLLEAISQAVTGHGVAPCRVNYEDIDLVIGV